MKSGRDSYYRDNINISYFHYEKSLGTGLLGNNCVVTILEVTVNRSTPERVFH